jgi:DnaA family protein
MQMKQIALDIGLATGPTLDSFVAGSNAGALGHLRFWSRADSHHRPGALVPTYLWGKPGSGKTHLLEALRASLREQGARVGWLDASVHTPEEYDESWAAVMLDEVHLYDPVQQHAAFKWFVNASTHRCWVLAAGDAAPADLRLREDLRSRLGWGDVFHLDPLDEAGQRQALRQEADARGIVLGAEVLDFMHKRFSRDLGSLKQLLDHLDGYGLRTKRAVTIPMLKSMLESE